MPAAEFVVHSELAADGETVIFMAVGNVEAAAKHLRVLTPTFKATKPPGGLQTHVSWPLVVQLASHLGPERWNCGPRLQHWIANAAEARYGYRPPLSIRVNEGAPPPREYQVAGAELIAATGKALIFDDPGTGKTLTTLLGLMEAKARGLFSGPALVIAPLSVVGPWIEAAERWTDFKPVAWRGNKQQRRRLASQGDLFVASYGVVTRDADPHDGGPLLDASPQAVVIDECHLTKSPQSLRSKAVRKLANRARVAVALSGTPITHHTADLFPVLNALDTYGWPSRERFVHRYMLTVSQDYGEGIVGINEHTEPEFRRCVDGQHRRLAKADVLSQLPPKVYSVRKVELPPAARKAYKSMEEDMLAEVMNGGELNAMTALTQLLRLRQLSGASADVRLEHTGEFDEYGEEKIITHVTLHEPSWKIDTLMEILEERADKQTLVFSPSRQLVELAANRATKDGYRVGRIMGGQSSQTRDEQVAAFQAGELNVMCATTGAGGVGLTLTAASTVVFLDRPWSFVEASQAEDRAHRIGSEQHESIEIIDIVATQTVDERVRDVLKGKAGALADLLEDPRIFTECLGGK